MDVGASFGGVVPLAHEHCAVASCASVSGARGLAALVLGEWSPFFALRHSTHTRLSCEAAKGVGDARPQRERK